MRITIIINIFPFSVTLSLIFCLVAESKWSRWSGWSDCTKTCGTGSRYRNRTCEAINDRAVFAPITCAGKAKQVKSCAEWGCPGNCIRSFQSISSRYLKIIR